jgi:hypothetical protein
MNNRTGEVVGEVTPVLRRKQDDIGVEARRETSLSVCA